MERKPIVRRARLEPGTGPGRKTAMPRQRSAIKPRPRKRTAPSKTGQTNAVRRKVDERDRGRCRRCGKPATNQQHREGRGAGGRGKHDAERTNSPAALVSICGQGNTSGCHKAIDEDRETAERLGWVIRRNGPAVDPTTVPIFTADHGWVLFDDLGEEHECDAPEGEAA